MPAIAPHAAIRRLEVLLVENAGDEIALVVVAAVELGAIDALKVPTQIKVLENAPRIDKGFRGAEKQPRPRRAKFRQDLRHAIVDDRLEQPVGRIAPAIDGERRLRVAPSPEQVGERSAQRRSDDPGEISGRRRASTQGFERQTETADDALGRIGQRSVEIDEERASPIGHGHWRSGIARCSDRWSASVERVGDPASPLTFWSGSSALVALRAGDPGADG